MVKLVLRSSSSSLQSPPSMAQQRKRVAWDPARLHRREGCHCHEWESGGRRSSEIRPPPAQHGSWKPAWGSRTLAPPLRAPTSPPRSPAHLPLWALLHRHLPVHHRRLNLAGRPPRLPWGRSGEIEGRRAWWEEDEQRVSWRGTREGSERDDVVERMQLDTKGGASELR
jgi:hypothetical protein